MLLMMESLVRYLNRKRSPKNMIILRCMTSLKMRDYPINELDDTKMVNIKNSKRVIKYYKKGGIAADSMKILLNTYLSQPYLG